MKNLRSFNCVLGNPPATRAGGCQIGAAQYKSWKHTQLIIDVASGPGNDFSLESADGFHFLSRSRLLVEDEVLEDV